MAYKITLKDEAVVYDAPGHYNMTATRLHNPQDVDGKLCVGYSHFQPGGGAEMAVANVELIYYNVEGEMTLTTDDGKKTVLRAGDSVHFAPGTGRSVENTGDSVASMLVIFC